MMSSSKELVPLEMACCNEGSLSQDPEWKLKRLNSDSVFFSHSVEHRVARIVEGP